MRPMNKSQRNRLHDLRMMVFASRDMIYRAATRDDTPFSDCLASAPIGHVEMLRRRESMLAEYERELIAAGRAWRDQFGNIQSY